MHLIYAVAKYERNRRIVDDLDNVRTPPLPLEEGIEFVKPGRESVHESIRGASGDGEPLMKATKHSPRVSPRMAYLR
jgi:hypothetical protein